MRRLRPESAGTGHPSVLELLEPERLAELVLQVAGEGDMVVCLGAGSITGWANGLPGALEQVGAPRS